MKPNFKIVTGPPFRCYCFECGKRLEAVTVPVYADLNGPAFKAYYCEPCKSRLENMDLDEHSTVGSVTGRMASSQSINL